MHGYSPVFQDALVCALLTLEKLLELIFIVASSQQFIDHISWFILDTALHLYHRTGH